MRFTTRLRNQWRAGIRSATGHGELGAAFYVDRQGSHRRPAVRLDGCALAKFKLGSCCSAPARGPGWVGSASRPGSCHARGLPARRPLAAHAVSIAGRLRSRVAGAIGGVGSATGDGRGHGSRSRDCGCGALESIDGTDQACVTTGRGGMTGASLNCQFRGCRAHARVLSSPLTTRCSARRSVVFRASGEFNLVGPANGHTAAAGQSLMRSLTRSSSTTWTNPSGRSSCCGRFERRSDGRRPRAQHAPQRGLARPALTRIEQRRVEPSSRPWGKGTVASPNNTHR